MDQQGFTGNSGDIGERVKHAAGLSPSMQGAVPISTARKMANDVVGIAFQNSKERSEDEKIKKYENFSSKINLIFMFEFFGGILAAGLASLGSKINKSKFTTVVKAIFVSPLDALRNTHLSELSQLPANYMKSVADYAKEAATHGENVAIKKLAERAHPGNSEEAKQAVAKFISEFDRSKLAKNTPGMGSAAWAEKATQRSANLSASGQRLAKDMVETLAPVTTPVRDTVRKGVTAFEDTAAGKGVLRGAENLVDWRLARKMAHYKEALGEAETALVTEVPGFWRKIGNFFSGAKPKHFGAHPALDEVTGHIASAKNAASAAERVTHTNAAKEALKGLLSHPDETVVKRVATLSGLLEKGHGAAGVIHGLESARGQGLTTIVKSLGKAAGRVPMLGALVGIGAAAGVTATLMTHRKDSRLEHEMHAEIVANIDPRSPIAQAFEKAHSPEKYKRAAKTGLSVVGEASMVAMMSVPGGGGAALMGAGFLPVAGMLLIKDNPMLNAYAVLRQEEKAGAQPLPPEQKLEMIRHLVASVPSVESHGGFYNRLTLPVSEAIMDKNLTAIETVKFLANEREFSALATEVQQKQKAQAAANAKPPVANDNHTAVVAAAPSPAPQIATGGKVLASSVGHEGRLDEMQKTASI